jgi:hypothetical protein
MPLIPTANACVTMALPKVLGPRTLLVAPATTLARGSSPIRYARKIPYQINVLPAARLTLALAQNQVIAPLKILSPADNPTTTAAAALADWARCLFLQIVLLQILLHVEFHILTPVEMFAEREPGKEFVLIQARYPAIYLMMMGAQTHAD